MFKKEQIEMIWTWLPSLGRLLQHHGALKAKAWYLMVLSLDSGTAHEETWRFRRTKKKKQQKNKTKKKEFYNVLEPRTLSALKVYSALLDFFLSTMDEITM